MDGVDGEEKRGRGGDSEYKVRSEGEWEKQEEKGGH